MKKRRKFLCNLLLLSFTILFVFLRNFCLFYHNNNAILAELFSNFKKISDYLKKNDFNKKKTFQFRNYSYKKSKYFVNTLFFYAFKFNYIKKNTFNYNKSKFD